MRFIDFFAGIGGFRRGMEQAGHKCVGFCEFDKFAVASYTSMHLLTDQQREKLKEIPLKKRQKEILKDEYRNGEWFANDIRTVVAGSLPAADCWCFGFPCQDISIAGKQAGFSGHRSSLFFAVTRLIRDTEEENRPRYLFIENVENLLSINGGGDFLKLLIELDEIGYDAEWRVINSKDFGVPQNRKRVFVIGHFRGKRTGKIFPVTRTDRENHISVGEKKKNIAIPVMTPDRINKRQNGRRFKDNGEPMFTLTAQDRHGVAVGLEGEEIRIKIKEATKRGYAEARKGDSINFSVPGSKTRRGRVGRGVAQTLDTNCNQGILIQVSEELSVYAVWNEKYHCYVAIRRLTPRECFRLQGWEDEYFDRAEFVNSDSQLYKQAGNGVTVNVIRAIAEKMKEQEDINWEE